MVVPPSILIVEDDELVRAFLTRALAGVAGDVSACEDGRSAIAAAQAKPFGLILLDGLLPDTHGIELAKQLVTSTYASSAAICFVSGMLRHPQPMRSGVSALPKPLRVMELIATATDLLDWHTHAAATELQGDRLAVLQTLAASLLVT
ncbi:MAG: response regulator [Candidatus Dormibacteraeota bacterium]|nr:response regulator [Candidatus Dormibacteraeota bacterium]